MKNQLIALVNKSTVYDPAEVMETLNSMNRDEVIAFLVWNDSNGIYLDLDCHREGVRVLTDAEAKLYAMKLLWENSPVNESENILRQICNKVLSYQDFDSDILEGCKLLKIDTPKDEKTSGFNYTEIEFEGIIYTCREITDVDNPDIKLTVAPEQLQYALTKSYGADLKDCDIDEGIFYYANFEELLLSDEQLFKCAF